MTSNHQNIRTLKHQKRKMKSKLLNAVWGAYLGCSGRSECSGCFGGDSRNHMLHSIYQRDMPEAQYLSMGLEAGYCWDFIADIYP